MSGWGSYGSINPPKGVELYSRYISEVGSLVVPRIF